MYEKVFQLTSRPFVSTPDVERFYSAQAIHHALTQACSSIERASGTVLVIGPTGSGKTLFLSMLEEQFKSVYKVVNLACARLAKREDLLQNILFSLNQPYLDMSEGELRLALIDYLRPDTQCPNGILLLVDEAHLLSASLLDEVRLLTNFVRNGRPRAQLVLAGNVRLEENLMDTSLDSFNQRVATRCYLSNFTQAETGQYISAAITRAGAPQNNIFTEDGMHVVHEVTEGCPRLINQVCDHAMILAAAANTSTIDAACVHEAWADVQHLPNPWAVAAEVSTVAPSEDSIEFGSLDDANEFAKTTEETKKQEPAPVSDEANEPQASPTNDVDSDWTQIEFGQLDEDESEQLRSLSSYDETINEAPETTYQLEQVVEEMAEPSTHSLEDQGTAEEYKLAPPEPILTPELPLEDFESVNELVEDYSLDSEVNEDYVDVRFKDLAQFLANGGKVDSQLKPEIDQELELEETDQIDIQDELVQSQELTQYAIETPPEIDEELEELIRLDHQPTNLRVHQDSPEQASNAEQSEAPAKTPTDIFGEWFEEEEVVHDQYTAFVAEQNTDSLNITRTQLAILDNDQQLDVVEQAAELLENVADQAPEEKTNEEVEHCETVEKEELETIEMSSSESERETDLALEAALSSSPEEHSLESYETDGAGLLETIHRQQAEIADQIFKLKKDLIDTGCVDSEMAEPIVAEQPVAHEVPDSESEDQDSLVPLETHLDSVNDDDRDILVITRVAPESAQDAEAESFEPEAPVSTGRAIRMNYRELFSQLRAAE